MKALLFPGQGSQIVGMGLEFYKNFQTAKDIFIEADDSLNFKISEIILEGPEQELKLTQNTQPSILTVSYAIYNVIKKDFNFNFDNFKYYVGHSLGEYSALVCSGSLKFKDALYLLHERGKAMQEAVPLGKGAMLAILGSDIDEIENLLNKIKNKGVCEIANDNANGQIIVSGEVNLINMLQDTLKEKKKKAILLPVSAPFHCSLMKSAAEKMKTKILPVNFNKPNIDIISNVTAQPENNPEKIKDLLVEQIYSRVRWRESIINMSKNNINEFIEIGPGKVLSGLSKRIIREAKANSINTIEDIKNNLK
jgi:[acyl-carrier-protein] S-malonyltransferase